MSFHCFVADPKSYVSSTFGIRFESISAPKVTESESASPKVKLPSITASPDSCNLPNEPVDACEPEMVFAPKTRLPPANVKALELCVSVTSPLFRFITPPLPKNRSPKGLVAVPSVCVLLLTGTILPLAEI